MPDDGRQRHRRREIEAIKGYEKPISRTGAIAEVGRAHARKDADLPASRRTSSVVCPSYLLSAPLRWRGRRPLPGDQRQDVGEDLSRYRDLGQLEGDIAAVADDLRADLDQLIARAGPRPRLRRLRHRQRTNPKLGIGCGPDHKAASVCSLRLTASWSPPRPGKCSCFAKVGGHARARRGQLCSEGRDRHMRWCGESYHQKARWGPAQRQQQRGSRHRRAVRPPTTRSASRRTAPRARSPF